MSKTITWEEWARHVNVQLKRIEDLLPNFANEKQIEWLRDEVKDIEQFLEAYLEPYFRARIVSFIQKNDGIRMQQLRSKLSMKREGSVELNFLDFSGLWDTFSKMKSEGKFKEEHRGKGRPIIYRLKEGGADKK